jgi:SAM-dependent methyltransferase
MKELLIGSGNKKVKYVGTNSIFEDVTTIDIDPNCSPDILHDLNITPWPVENNLFDEIHAYHVLEHLGQQGDYKSFFAHFYECWRVLKDGGHLIGLVPNDDVWRWGDPGHTRVITSESLFFLNQEHYAEVGTTSMTDYRWCWNGNFELVWEDKSRYDGYYFVLEKRAHNE